MQSEQQLQVSNKLLLISCQPERTHTHGKYENKHTHINTKFYRLCVFAKTFAKMTSCSISDIFFYDSNFCCYLLPKNQQRLKTTTTKHACVINVCILTAIQLHCIARFFCSTKLFPTLLFHTHIHTYMNA